MLQLPFANAARPKASLVLCISVTMFLLFLLSCSHSMDNAGDPPTKAFAGQQVTFQGGNSIAGTSPIVVYAWGIDGAQPTSAANVDARDDSCRHLLWTIPLQTSPPAKVQTNVSPSTLDGG